MTLNIKKSRTAQWYKNTSLCHTIHNTQGDWRYPFIAFGWLLAKWLVPRRKVNVDGVSFTLSCTNWITHFRWYLFKTKEQEVRRYIDQYVHDGDVFFDIGANVGIFTIYTAKRYNHISVYSFEPEYSNLNLLKDNIVHNNLNDKVAIYSLAVSDFVGLTRLNIQDITPGSAAHTESKDSISMTDEGYPVVWAEGVMACTIDHICEQLRTIPNCIKIDTDGNEEKILRGAKKTLAQPHLRSLVIEMPSEGSKHDFCLSALEAAGFTLTWSNPPKTKNEIWAKKGHGGNHCK